MARVVAPHAYELEGKAEDLGWRDFAALDDPAAALLENLGRTENGAAWLRVVPGAAAALRLIALELAGRARASSRAIFPRLPDVFAALHRVHPDAVRVVILGQDPYPNRSAMGEPNACGRAFMSRGGVPGSLRNVYKEIADCGFPGVAGAGGDLSSWEEQGVLLLNACLTVTEGEAGGHRRQWEAFVAPLLAELVNGREGQNIAFLLWGRNAERAFDDAVRGAPRADRLALRTSHPSGFSVRKGFFGCKHFSRVNRWLLLRDEEPIRWDSVGDTEE